MRQAKSKRKDNTLSALVLYIFGFLLLWEWLRPLSTITDTNYISIFVIFTGFLFLLSYFQLSFWLSFPIKLIAMVYSVQSIFFPIAFTDFQWVSYFIEDLKANAMYLINGQWGVITPMSKTVLFFILLWLISYLMHYWLIQSRKIFLFFLVTILYVTVIDTFTPYDATFAIIRTLMVGFILLGVLRYIRIIESEGFSIKKGSFPVMWIIPLVLIISFSSLLGYLAPKAAPQWPDPVSFIKSADERADDGLGNGGIQRIGYGVNDSKLGGPFVMDDGPVFTAEIQEMQYWKVETKEVYTGKGWESQAEEVTLQDVNPDNIDFESVSLNFYEDSVEQEPYNARIKLDKGTDFQFVVMPGEPKNIKAQQGIDYKINPISGKVIPFNQANPISLESYEVGYSFPKFSIEKLRAAGTTYPGEVTSTYLQLPESLPQEVGELAKQITANEDNPYDMAKTIESYFSSNGFEYETEKVAVPKGDEDYVAQFLFDTKMGYCDNFSTSMVVMLRTLGIPARWVKGFTQGDYKDSLDNGYSLYEITNANAHSWVEAYFPGIGWVPFEPTQGFNSPFDFVAANSSTGNNNSNIPAGQDQTPDQDKQKEKEKVKNSSSSFDLSDLWKCIKTSMWVILLVLIIIVPIAYFTRKKWLNKFYLLKFKGKSEDTTFFDAYKRLLWLLNVYGIKRPPHMTLREFAQVVDKRLDTTDMKRLTLQYEHARYGKGDQVAWLESRDFWENLIKKLPS